MSFNYNMPVLFLAHGSPLNAIQDNEFTRSLKRLGGRLPRPKVILVVSAHWLTSGTCVTGGESPRTIHDFYGFPRELYEIQYPSPGAPAMAGMIIKTVKSSKIAISEEWGLDHASWSLLKYLYPEADIPVLELSLDKGKPPRYHFELARELEPLRREGVLIIGSGNIVHNLSLANFEQMNAVPCEWALQFDLQVREHLLNRSHDALIDYHLMGRAAALSIPTNEHYLPLLYAAAIQEPGEEVSFPYEGIQNGSVSMRCAQFG